jgi:hypothetical protein
MATMWRLIRLLITLARSATGILSVVIECRLGLIRPLPRPEARSAPTAAHAGTS